MNERKINFRPDSRCSSSSFRKSLPTTKFLRETITKKVMTTLDWVLTLSGVWATSDEWRGQSGPEEETSGVCKGTTVLNQHGRTEERVNGKCTFTTDHGLAGSLPWTTLFTSRRNSEWKERKGMCVHCNLSAHTHCLKLRKKFLPGPLDQWSSDQTKSWLRIRKNQLKPVSQSSIESAMKSSESFEIKKENQIEFHLFHV